MSSGKNPDLTIRIWSVLLRTLVQVAEMNSNELKWEREDIPTHVTKLQKDRAALKSTDACGHCEVLFSSVLVW